MLFTSVRVRNGQKSTHAGMHNAVRESAVVGSNVPFGSTYNLILRPGALLMRAIHYHPLKTTFIVFACMILLFCVARRSPLAQYQTLLRTRTLVAVCRVLTCGPKYEQDNSRVEKAQKPRTAEHICWFVACRWTHVSSLVDEAHSPAAVAVKYAPLERKEMKLCITTSRFTAGECRVVCLWCGARGFFHEVFHKY